MHILEVCYNPESKESGSSLGKQNGENGRDSVRGKEAESVGMKEIVSSNLKGTF